MDDLIVAAVLGLVVGGLGWVLGIAGFVLARRALARVRTLERRLAGLAGVAPESFQAPAFVAAPPIPAAPAPARSEPAADPVFVAEATSMPVAGGGSLEARLTMRLGVWLGAAALLLAAVFLVRYAADAGFLGPAVRCGLAGLLGVGLLAAGFWAKRRDDGRALEDYVPGALAAGGVATLLAAAYGAGPLYRLVLVPVDFVLLAAAGLVGMVASLQLGWLVAAVGLAGAYATPLLAIQPEHPSYPGLFLYLAVVTAAAFGVVRYAAWVWLGWAATMAGAAYVIAASATIDRAEVWAAAGFVPVAAALALLLLPAAATERAVGRRLAWVNFAVMGLAGLALCASVDDWTDRAGVLLLAPLAIWRGASRVRLDRLPWLAGVFFLLMLLVWVVPAWQATGEVLATDTWRVVLPGAWAPEAIRPLLLTAAVMSVGFAGAGLWFERRAERPAVWAALVAAVPVLALGLTYAQVQLFQTDARWAAAALVLACGLIAAARWAPTKPAMGAHAAGAVGALALGCAMLLSDQWLSVSLALFLPPLAWVEGRSGLRELRLVALAVALLVLGRLLLNWFVLDYAFGRFPVLNGLLPAYGVPAVGFAVSAWMFRKRGQDLATAVLEAGAAAFTVVLVAAEIHHWATGGVLAEAPVGFLEYALHVMALSLLAMAVLRISRRVEGVVLARTWQVIGGLAFVGAGGLLVFNPAVTGAAVGTAPILDALLPAYGVPAVVAALVRRDADISGKLRWVVGAYAMLAGLAWVTLEVRHLFHPDAMSFDIDTFGDAELWAYSGVWLAYGAALLGSGIATALPEARRAGLAVVALAAVKVFLIDMAGIGGLWRVVSFLGLGLMLIGLGAIYRRFVVTPQPGRLQG